MAGAPGPETLREDLELHKEELAAQNEELRRANAELVQSRERHTELYDFAPIGYVTLDGRGDVVEANLTAARMLGRSRGELVGRPFAHVVLASERGVFRSFCESLLARGERSTLEIAMEGVAAPFHAHVHGARLDVRDGDSQCVLALTDDTPRREAERLRREAEASVAEQDRLESLRVLAGGVAHDFNNLLAVILAMTDLGLRGLPAESPLIELLETAAEAGKRASALSRQLLAYTGRARIESTLLDLARVVEDIEPVLRALVAPSVTLTFEIERPLPCITGDVARLDQMLLNLVLNASQSIGTRPGHVVVSLTSSGGDAVTLSVTDDGDGMSEVVRRRAFDPFFTTKRPGQGLGLAVVLGTVRAHSGEIVCESPPSGGTRFRVTFPASPGAVPAREGARPTPKRRPAHILVVDDQPLMLSTCARLLTLLGYTTDTAGGGEEAVAMFSRQPLAYDAVLIDRTMPGVDGRETLTRLRRVRPDVHAVFMSGYSTDESHATLTPWSLPKPFTLDELDAALAKALAT